MICDFCGREMGLLENDLRDARYLSEGSYSVYFCENCRVGKTFPYPSNLDDLYQNVYPDKQKIGIKRIYNKILNTNYVSMLLLKMDRCDKFLDLISHKEWSNLTILDVGCGTGNWMIALKNKGGIVAGVDLNPNAVKVAEGRGLNVRCMSAEGLVDLEERFDMVFMSQILEHLVDPVETLKTISKLLKPNGKLVMALPNFDSYFRVQFKREWINWYVPYHIFHHTKESTTIALSLAGFQTNNSITYTPPSWWLNSLILKWSKDKPKWEGRKRVYPWWLPLFYMPTCIYLWWIERKRSDAGDCLCLVASKIGSE